MKILLLPRATNSPTPRSPGVVVIQFRLSAASPATWPCDCSPVVVWRGPSHFIDFAYDRSPHPAKH